MTARIVFSESARQDRQAITAYTVEHFGIGQARQLRQNFEKVMNALATNPGLGRRRAELDPPGSSFRYLVIMKVFLLVYRPTEEGIEVARIIHSSRDLAAELERDAGSIPDQGG